MLSSPAPQHASYRCDDVEIDAYISHVLAVAPLVDGFQHGISMPWCDAKVLLQVAGLFRRHDDLLQEFTYFLPDSTAPAAQHVRTCSPL